jgi:hypothetical protein
MSKGSNRRKEDVKKIRDNWDAIFGKKDPKEPKPKEPEQKNAK